MEKAQHSRGKSHAGRWAREYWLYMCAHTYNCHSCVVLDHSFLLTQHPFLDYSLGGLVLNSFTFMYLCSCACVCLCQPPRSCGESKNKFQDLISPSTMWGSRTELRVLCLATVCLRLLSHLQAAFCCCHSLVDWF